MKHVQLKTGLFGFRRKQVLAYLNEVSADFANQTATLQQEHTRQMQQVQSELEEKIRLHETALMMQIQENERLDGVNQEMSQSLDLVTEKLVAQQEETRLVAQRLQEEQTAHAFAQQQYDQAMEQLEQLQQQLVAKDNLIADQVLEVANLQSMVGQLEEEFTVLREESRQTTAMAEYMNVLQERNRTLVQRIAQLEAQIEDLQHADQAQAFADIAQKRQSSVETVENLFANVFREIQDALENLSKKIDGQSSPQTGGQVLDMANL